MARTEYLVVNSPKGFKKETTKDLEILTAPPLAIECPPKIKAEAVVVNFSIQSSIVAKVIDYYSMGNRRKTGKGISLPYCWKTSYNYKFQNYSLQVNY